MSGAVERQLRSQTGKPSHCRQRLPYFGNRVLFPYFAGFQMLVSEGPDFQQIDKVMERFGYRWVPHTSST